MDSYWIENTRVDRKNVDGNVRGKNQCLKLPTSGKSLRKWLLRNSMLDKKFDLVAMRVIQ